MSEKISLDSSASLYMSVLLTFCVTGNSVAYSAVNTAFQKHVEIKNCFTSGTQKRT